MLNAKSKYAAALTTLILAACQGHQQGSDTSAAPAPAQPSAPRGRAADLGGPLTVSGDLSTDLIYSDSNPDMFADDTVRTRGMIRLTAELAENIRAVLGIKIDHMLRENGNNSTINVDLKKWLAEAYVEIRNVGGKPVAFVLGKQPMAFGQHISDMPMFNGSGPLYDASKYDEVIGFTVKLSDVPFFDLVEASVFETTPGDLSIGDIDGASVRLTKNLSDKIKAELSILHAGNGSKEDENRVSLGFVFKDGAWTTWAEGLYLDGSKQYPDAKIGLTVGASRDMGPGKVVVEATYIQKSLAQIGLGYQLRLNQNLTVGPEVRYTRFDNGGDDWSVGVRARFTFDTK